MYSGRVKVTSMFRHEKLQLIVCVPNETNKYVHTIDSLLNVKRQNFTGKCFSFYLTSLFYPSQAHSLTQTRMKKLGIFLLVVFLCLEGGFAKEKGAKKGKKKGKQVYCPS